jgi:hypothetical protein
MKHVFFNTGDDSYISLMCPTADMPDHPKKWATDINSGLGVMNGTYHFAFGPSRSKNWKRSRPGCVSITIR